MKVLQVPDSEVEVPKSLHDVNPIKLTKWTKEPNINDLKYDLRQAQSSQSLTTSFSLLRFVFCIFLA